MRARIENLLCLFLLALLGCTPGEVPEDKGGAQDSGPHRDGGEPTDASREDAGERDDSGEEIDAGEPSDDGGPPLADAGMPAADSGPEPDAGPLPDDEAGDLSDPLDITLPFSVELNHVPAGDLDCLRFEVTTPGTFLAEGAGALTTTCTGGGGDLSENIRFWLFHDGETSFSSSISSNDSGGQGNCPRISRTLFPGGYVLCSGQRDRVNPLLVYGAQVSLDFIPFLCGNGTVDPGEECDGVEGCSSQCLIEDGLPREDEDGGNDTPGGLGVLQVGLGKTHRGEVYNTFDEDWWRVQLPGAAGPGALTVRLGNANLDATACGTASALRAELYSGGDFSVPVAESRTASPCRGIFLTELAGDLLFGNELLWLRVRVAGTPTPYHVVVDYIPEVCGDGVLQPSEECEPGVGSLGTICDPLTCRLAPPEHDVCDDAIDVTDELPTDGTHFTRLGDTTSASNQTSWTGAGSCLASTADHKDVHYTFVAPRSGRVAFVLAERSFTARLYATSGRCEAPIVCSSTTTELELDVVAGERYTTVVDGYSTGSGSFVLEGQYLITPENDECSDEATPVEVPADGTPLLLEGSTRAASNQASVQGCTQSSTGDHKDVFHAFIAPIAGTIEARLDASYSSPRLYARESCAGPELACGTTSMRLDVAAGETFVVVVDAFSAAKGRYALELDYVPSAAD
jgi:hypothetical protein